MLGRMFGSSSKDHTVSSWALGWADQLGKRAVSLALQLSTPSPANSTRLCKASGRTQAESNIFQRRRIRYSTVASCRPIA